MPDSRAPYSGNILRDSVHWRPKGSKLYQDLLNEVRTNTDNLRTLWSHKNLGQISRKAKKLLRESDSHDCITREGWLQLREEERFSRLCNRMLERVHLLKERDGLELTDTAAGKLVLLFASIDAIRRSLRTSPRFSKH
jgi:hypothetical protein